MLSIVAHFARGFAVGITDLIPGFSGATTAFILGVYEKLIAFISGFFRALRNPKLFKELEWSFIIPFCIGILLAVFALASALEVLLTNHPESMAGVFCGFGLAAIFSLLFDLRVSLSSLPRSKMKNAILLFTVIAVGALFFWVLGSQADILKSPSLWTFFFGGVVASIALILPGISGSFVLLMIGLYPSAIMAISDLEITNILSLALGVVVGILAFAYVLNYLLNKFRPHLMAVMTGLLIGSFRVLWPWPNGVGIIDSDTDKIKSGTGLEWPSWGDLWVPALLAMAGLFFVAIFTIFKLFALKQTMIYRHND